MCRSSSLRCKALMICISSYSERATPALKSPPAPPRFRPTPRAEPPGVPNPAGVAFLDDALVSLAASLSFAACTIFTRQISRCLMYRTAWSYSRRLTSS